MFAVKINSTYSNRNIMKCFLDSISFALINMVLIIILAFDRKQEMCSKKHDFAPSCINHY